MPNKSVDARDLLIRIEKALNRLQDAPDPVAGLKRMVMDLGEAYATLVVQCDALEKRVRNLEQMSR